MTTLTLDELLARRDALEETLAPARDALNSIKRQIRPRKAGAASGAARSGRVVERDLNILTAMATTTSPRLEKLKLARKHRLSLRSIDRVLQAARVSAAAEQAAAAAAAHAASAAARSRRRKKPSMAPADQPASTVTATKVQTAQPTALPRRRSPRGGPSVDQVEMELTIRQKPSMKK